MMDKEMIKMIRAEHNCHLCKKEYLGRCHGDKYGKDVSIDDMPVCDGYVYGGSAEHLIEIEYAQSKGITELSEEQIKALKVKTKCDSYYIIN